MIARTELELLRVQLRQAQNDFELAKYIDSYPRMVSERDACARRIRALEERIAEAERRQET